MLNNITLQGRLVATPELKTTVSGVSVTTFTVAVQRDYKSNGEEITDFIPCVAWRNTAELISRYFNKGSMIFINGSLETRSYEDKQGNKRTAYEVKADRVYFGSAKNEKPNINVGHPQEPSFAENVPVDVSDFEEIGTDDELPF